MILSSKNMTSISGSILPFLPFFAKGKVIKGFGRGSKDLGIPTANLQEDVIETLPREIDTGIYYGFASVDAGPVHKMVMSIGWNPFYNNKKKSMEVHILHNFSGDFYGHLLRICILGYIRAEKSFESLESLKEAIEADIMYASKQLDLPEFSAFRRHSFFGSYEIDGFMNNGHFPGSNL